MNRSSSRRSAVLAMLALGALVLCAGTGLACPVTISNENPAGPTPVPDVNIGTEQVTGQVVVAGGGGMSPVQFSSSGQAQSGGVTGGGGTTGGTNSSNGDITYSGAVGTATGNVTQTSPSSVPELIPTTGPINFTLGTFLSGGSGRYITPPGGSAYGTANFTTATSIQFTNGLPPGVTVGQTGTVTISGDGVIKGAMGTITGGRPVAGVPASIVPVGPPLHDANIRYGDD